MDMAAVNVLVGVKPVRSRNVWTWDVPLARFRPAGVSRNPAGRLRGVGWRDRLRFTGAYAGGRTGGGAMIF